MGIKRSDQYASNRPESGGADHDERSFDESVLNEEKQELASNEDEKGLIPKRRENPAQARVKASRARKQKGS
ncbi:MAG: hypothetical protein ACR2G6_07530 [Gemmatimonadaceae bacterium]